MNGRRARGHIVEVECGGGVAVAGDEMRSASRIQSDSTSMPSQPLGMTTRRRAQVAGSSLLSSMPGRP